MSDFFATEQDQNQARVDATLTPPEQRRVGFFDDPSGNGGLFEGANTVIPRAFANVGEGVHAGLGYLARQIPDESIPLWHSFDSEALGRFFDQQVAEDRSFRQRWTVDPGTRSEAAGMVSDLAETLATFSIGGVLGGPEAGAVLGPTIAGASYGSQTYGELRSRGVDPTTARGAGLITGTAMGAMGFAPVSVPGTLVQRALSGAGINLAFGVGQRGSMNAYLNAQGYPELAREYQWYDGRAAATDAIFGAVFGTLFGHGGGAPTPHRGGEPEGATPAPEPLTPQQESDLRDLGAAALVERGALQDETAFGAPTNHASRRWASDALDRAEAQARNDDPIDPGPVPDGVEFVPLPDEAAQARFEQAIAEHLAESGLSPDEVSARMSELRSQASSRSIDPSEGALYSMGPARRVGAREDGGPERNDRLVTPEGVRLTPTEHKAAEMAHNGARRQWIAEEMDTNANNVGVLLNKAKRKYEQAGHEVPWARENAGRRQGQGADGGDTATIEEILALRDHLQALGYQDYRHIVPIGAVGNTTLTHELARRLSLRYRREIKPSAIASRLSKYRRDVASGAREPAKYSLTENPAFSTEAELNARASELLGADWTALSRAGFVEMWPTAADIPHGGTGVPPGVKAVHFPSQRRTYFVASNIRPRELKGLILHEIGVHHGMEDMLGKRGWNEVLRQLEGMVESDHPDVVAARRDAERFAGNSADIEEETLAYLIESQADLPLVQNLLSRLRQWLIKTFGSTFGMRLTVDDLRGLALSSLRRVAEQARREAGDFTTIGPMDEALASQSGRPQPPFYSTVERVVSESSTARASGSQWLATISKAPGVKREELDWIGLPDFLKATDAPISREDVLSFIRANGVQVEETVLSEGGADTSEIQREMLPLIEERDRLSAALGERLALPDSPEGARITEINDRIRQLQERRDQQLSGRNATRWSQYALPGGENYRELLLRLPEERKSLDQWRVLRPDGISDGLYSSEQAAQTRAQAINGTVERAQNQEVIAGFHTQHWSGHSNILAHVRFNERVDSEGRRTLFMEEVQSDWHQGGRERGYRAEPVKPAHEYKPEDFTIRETELQWHTTDANGVERDVGKGTVSGEQGAREYFARWLSKLETERVQREQLEASRSVPDAPFKNNAWAALSLKRMIRWAAENGFDAIAWTRGQHQIERFSLEKVVERIGWGRREDGNYDITVTPKNGDPAISRDNQTAADLAELIGQDAAKRITESSGEPYNNTKYKGGPRIVAVGELTGPDLRTGGHGMRAFYDRILPNIANDIGRKYGARVGETEIVTNPTPGTRTLAREEVAKPVTETVHSLPITPELRAQALEGMPLFSKGAGKNGQNRADPVESEGFQRRLRDVEDRLNADGVLARTALGKKSEAGGSFPRPGGRVEPRAGEGVAGGDRTGAGGAEGSPRPLRLPREVVGDILSVSGIKIEKSAGDFGDHRVTIDLPHDLDPSVADAFHPERTLIRFNLIEQGADKRIITRWSHTADPIRGTKAGRWLYRQLVNWALEHGYQVHSDYTLSPSSQRIYESLQRSGYELIKDRTAQIGEDGWLTTDKPYPPVYRVKAGAIADSAEIVMAAPEPRGGYEIGGPTLKDRLAPLVEAQARRDQYDKLSPAEQAIADNPGMEFPAPGNPRQPPPEGVGANMGRRPNPERMTARELMDYVKAETERAQEMKKGFEAAARCAARHGAAPIARGVQYGVGVVNDAWLGQVLGLAASIPIGVTAAPIIARDARRYATPGSTLDRQNAAEIQSRFDAARQAGEQAGAAAGLDNPSTYDTPQGEPFSQSFEPNPQAPPPEQPLLPGEPGGGYTENGAKVPPAPASFGEGE